MSHGRAVGVAHKTQEAKKIKKRKGKKPIYTDGFGLAAGVPNTDRRKTRAYGAASEGQTLSSQSRFYTFLRLYCFQGIPYEGAFVAINSEKKRRPKIPQESKVRADLQKEINSICPFCDNDDVGHFQIHHIDENPSNNELVNLLLLCPTCHSKITKGDITNMQVLQTKIKLFSGVLNKKEKQTEKIINVDFKAKKIVSAFVGNNNTVIVKEAKPAKKGKHQYPEGCIGYDVIKANYISYLIDKYHKYKEADVGKAKMNYAIFPSSIKRQFSIGKTRTIYNIPIEKFEEVCFFIKKRIDGTILGKIKGKTQRNYSSFDEYVLK